MTIMQRLSLIVVSCLVLFVTGAEKKDYKAPDNGVSIEEFIDLDATPASMSKDGVESTPESDTTNLWAGFPSGFPIPKGYGNWNQKSHGPNKLMSDDEDVEISGDGSGSGDTPEMQAEAATKFTDTSLATSTQKTSEQTLKSNVTTRTTQSPMTAASEAEDSGETVTPGVSTIPTSTARANSTTTTAVYGGDVWPPVPVREQTDGGEDIPRWSPWIRTNDVTEVRVRTCTGSQDPCNGTEAQMRHCDRESNRCDVLEAVLMSEDDVKDDIMECSGSGSGDSAEQTEDVDQVIKPVQHSRPLPPAQIDLQRTELEPCTYSLFDLKRGKYLVTEWSLTRLVTQAKVRKWCAKPKEYLVFHSPHAHCRRYYKDLCHVSMRCKGSRGSPKARGDFAEGCWRQFVYGGQLPVGLSNRQTIVYLICQRYAANSALGKMFGHRHSHFATLYDTKGRAPVVSLVKLTSLGDEAWPETPYFIEHGLVEDAEDTAWFLRKAKKGIVRLDDMGKCQDEDSCQLGAHQVLPNDYSATTYRVAPLLWPELAGPDPLTRTSTFTLTNTAPMHSQLYPAWHRAVLHVRQFALQQCGVPHVTPAHFVSSVHGHKARAHHGGRGGGGGGGGGYGYADAGFESDQSAVYVASGIIPSTDPMETIGNDINVPFMFWMAVCCVNRNESSFSSSSPQSSASGGATNNNDNDGHYQLNDYANLFEHDPRKKGQGQETGGGSKHLSFAVYARNTGPGSSFEDKESATGAADGERKGQVVAAPVLQLEMLLQDIYKTLPTDADVNLFPASQGACSELRNDFSRNMRL